MHIVPVNIVEVAIASPALIMGAGLVTRARFRALAGLLLAFGIHMVLNFIEETKLFGTRLGVTSALGLLYGPLLFLLIRGLIYKGSHLVPRDLVHGLPALVALIALLASDPIGWVRLAAAISLLAYSTAIFLSIWRYHKAADATRSDADALRLNWVIGFFAGFVILTLIDAARMMTADMRGPFLNQLAFAAVILSAGGLFAAMTGFALARPRWFEGLTERDFGLTAPRGEADAAKDVGDRIAFDRLEAVMQAERYFLEPHLTLSDLASRTGGEERELSRAINRVGGRNFCDYVNGLRAREAARLLLDPARQKHTVLELAFEAGFSSKSTFNTAFKKEFGQTPSAYRRVENSMKS